MSVLWFGTLSMTDRWVPRVAPGRLGGELKTESLPHPLVAERVNNWALKYLKRSVELVKKGYAQRAHKDYEYLISHKVPRFTKLYPICPVDRLFQNSKVLEISTVQYSRGLYVYQRGFHFCFIIVPT